MLYFDTSFLAPLILEEETSDKVEAFIAALPVDELVVSHWTRTEFATLLAREVRMAALTEKDALAAFDQFDAVLKASFRVMTPDAPDFDLATEYIRHFATKLRAGDALHLAIARNHGVRTLYSLDRGLLAAAKVLKVKASHGIRGWRRMGAGTSGA